MAMCVYKYVFNKHVIYGGDGGGGGGGGPGADSGIYYRGASCIGEGFGGLLGPEWGQGGAKGGGGSGGGQGPSPPEAPGN